MFFREPLRLLPRGDRVQLGPPSLGSSWGKKLLDQLADRCGAQLAVRLLPNRVNRILQIGYGNGVFMPELDSRANQLFGIDDHSHGDEVQDRLRLNGVNAQLVRGLAETLPYQDGYFDRIVIMHDMGANGTIDWENAALEIVRALNPTGRLVFVLGRKSAAQERVLLRSFEVVRELRLLPLLPKSMSLVRVLDLQPYAVDVTPHSRGAIRQRIAV